MRVALLICCLTACTGAPSDDLSQFERSSSQGSEADEKQADVAERLAALPTASEARDKALNELIDDTFAWTLPRKRTTGPSWRNDPSLGPLSVLGADAARRITATHRPSAPSEQADKRAGLALAVVGAHGTPNDVPWMLPFANNPRLLESVARASMQQGSPDGVGLCVRALSSDDDATRYQADKTLKRVIGRSAVRAAPRAVVPDKKTDLFGVVEKPAATINPDGSYPSWDAWWSANKSKPTKTWAPIPLK